MKGLTTIKVFVLATIAEIRIWRTLAIRRRSEKLHYKHWTTLKRRYGDMYIRASKKADDSKAKLYAFVQKHSSAFGIDFDQWKDCFEYEWKRTWY